MKLGSQQRNRPKVTVIAIGDTDMRKLLTVLFAVMFLFVIAATTRPAAATDTVPPTNPNFPLKLQSLAKPYFTRTFQWTIDKSADQSALTLTPGQVFPVNYTVTVDKTFTESGFGARGYIRVINLDTVNGAAILSIQAVVTGDIPMAVTCPKMDLAPGEWIDCTFDGALPDKTTRTNTASVTALINGVEVSRTDTTPVDFASPHTTVTEQDACINVTDSAVGALGAVCVGDAPKSFQYSLTFGAEGTDVIAACGESSYPNIASFVAANTGATGSDAWTVTTNMTCAGGCTLTQGYWKTHSSHGPAPYDAAWAGREDQTFFSSGMTWYGVFWTPPAGNPYYNLAHQYMAAYLNKLNGAASTAAVDGALAEAEALFGAYGPNTAWSKAQKTTLTRLAGVLDGYNNGLSGPGHCSE